jgi:NifU-like protein involved in Fe-S cluster formation
MDQGVIKYYRGLLRTGFKHSGTLEDPNLLLDSETEQIVHCGNIGNYMLLYVQVVDGVIEDIKYTCSCDPPANVAVEILCALTRGKTLEEAKALREEAFTEFLGCESEVLRKRAQGLLELLNKGLARLQA